MAFEPEISLDDLRRPPAYPQIADEPEDISLMNVLADLGGASTDAEVKVYRASAAKGNKGGAFLFSCAPEEFTLESIRDNYGGGDYRVHVRANGGIVANRLVSIEEPKRPMFPVAAQQPTTANNDALEKMMAAMVQGFQGLGQLIVQSNQKPVVDPMQSQRDTISLMLSMKELFGSNSGGNQIESALGMFQKGMELAREMTPRDTAEPMDMLMEAFKTFGPVIANATAQRQNNAADVAYTATPQSPQQIQPQLSASQGTPEMADPKTATYVNMLVSLARENRDHELYAEMIVDQVPENEIRAMLDRPDLIEHLARFNPEVRNHTAWIDALKNSVLGLLTDTPESGTVPAITQIGPENTNAIPGLPSGTTYQFPIADNGDVAANPVG